MTEEPADPVAVEASELRLLAEEAMPPRADEALDPMLLRAELPAEEAEEATEEALELRDWADVPVGVLDWADARALRAATRKS